MTPETPEIKLGNEAERIPLTPEMLKTAGDVYCTMLGVDSLIELAVGGMPEDINA